ncbi:EmrB/QacA subfamily drug resistance transporter [Rhodoblastus sphagnicola]|uniref:MFS transporter n=1 Tax=Rhodoblastus sphagnicola TaxID=333368 RepID=UPI0017B6EDAA|nr:MFS transporter [Rhodoblastus sphagnicola]MBB4196240.1 EmrB/QacA subfamily drug resistance transporter [Rhodoblastus sphagnicola]
MRPFLTPLIVACALFMENLDSTIVSTSLPAIASDLHQDPIALKLSMTSYLLAQAVFIPASGWVADRFGARTVFRAAILVFTIGSILCGLSSTLPQFVAARIVQGCGGAMMAPVGRLALMRSVERSDLVRALAWLTIPALIGPMLGPPVGGFISTYFHWRWNFWINVPIGMLGITLVSLYIGEFREENPTPFDTRGFVLSGLGLSSVIFGLTVLGRGFLPLAAIVALILFGLICLALYVRHARTAPSPILDLTLFRIKTYRASVIGGSLFRIGVGATPFLLPLLLQLGFGMTPFQSGLTTFVATAGALIMKATAASALQKFGFRTVLLINGLISSLLLAAIGLFGVATPQAALMAVLFAGGFFRSLQFTAINALAYADIDAARLSKATSFYAVAQQLALSAGVTFAAAALEIARALSGGALGAKEFPPAFFTVALISATSLLVFLPLARDAGSKLSGHGGEAEVTKPDPA